MIDNKTRPDLESPFLDEDGSESAAAEFDEAAQGEGDDELLDEGEIDREDPEVVEECETDDQSDDEANASETVAGERRAAHKRSSSDAFRT